jgi:hypothetical protein
MLVRRTAVLCTIGKNPDLVLYVLMMMITFKRRIL